MCRSEAKRRLLYYSYNYTTRNSTIPGDHGRAGGHSYLVYKKKIKPRVMSSIIIIISSLRHSSYHQSLAWGKIPGKIPVAYGEYLIPSKVGGTVQYLKKQI